MFFKLKKLNTNSLHEDEFVALRAKVYAHTYSGNVCNF